MGKISLGILIAFIDYLLPCNFGIPPDQWPQRTLRVPCPSIMVAPVHTLRTPRYSVALMHLREVMQGLFPCLSLLTYISSPWHPAVLSPNSEVLRGYLVCPPLFGTPQATRGKGRSITPSYYQLVYLNHFRSLSLEGFSVWWYLLNHYGRTTRLLFLGGLVYYMIFLC